MCRDREREKAEESTKASLKGLRYENRIGDKKNEIPVIQSNIGIFT